jgi:membrane protein involved in D-alanine export
MWSLCRLYEPDEVQLFPSEQNAGAKYRYFCTLFCMGAWNGLERHYVISGALFGAISVAHNMLLWSAKRSPALHRASVSGRCVLGRILTLGSAAPPLHL